MIGGPAAFCRFVRHDLRLSARGLMSMFGGISPGRVGAIAAALFAALHGAAWPVAGWLTEIEGGPNGGARIMMILATGAMLIIPWIVAQSIDRPDPHAVRALGPRTDPLLAGRDAEPACRARLVDRDRRRRIGWARAGAARRRGRAQGRRALARALSRPARGWPHGNRPRRHSGDGPHSGGRPAPGARPQSDRSDDGWRGFRALGRRRSRCCPTGCARQSSGRFEPPGGGVGALHSLVWTPVSAAAGDYAAMFGFAAFGVAVFALACALFGERFAQAAVVASGAPANARVSASRIARFGASVGATLRIKERRVVWRDPWLMSQLLLQAAYTMPVAVILWRSGGPTGTVAIAFAPTLVVIAAQLAGALVLDRAVGRGCAGFSQDRSGLARRRRARQDRRHRPADRAHSRSSRCCARFRFAVGRPLRARVRRRSDRLGGAGQLGDKLRLAAASCSAVIRSRSSSV